jgi:hypothetical protein
MHIINKSAGVDFSNPAALNRGEILFSSFYEHQLRVEVAKLLQTEPNLMLVGWDGSQLDQPVADTSLLHIWPAEFAGDAEAFTESYSFELRRVRLDCNPMGIGRDRLIWLGPIELIRLYASGQLVLDPGDSIFCAGFSAIMPNDGRRGSFAFQRSQEGRLALVLFERQSLIDDGDHCAGIVF